jgi:hypothetical protein
MREMREQNVVRDATYDAYTGTTVVAEYTGTTVVAETLRRRT